MASFRRVSFPLFLCLLFLIFLSPPTAGDPLFTQCDTIGNYTAKSTYESNLMNLLLPSLASNTSLSGGFLNATVGQIPNQIHGLAMCRGDANASVCRSCLSGAIQDAPQLCPYNKGATVEYDDCLLRYSNQRFFSAVDSSMRVFMWNAQNVTGFNPKSNVTESNPNKNVTARSGFPEEFVGKKKNVTSTVLAIVLPLVAAFALISIICICIWRRRKPVVKLPLDGSSPEEIAGAESLLLDISTLRVATANFSEENKLGEGGFGVVYKGLLPDGREIAVKRLSTSSSQGFRELRNELVLVAKLQHRNLVRLLGVCLEEQEKLLVYEYVPNRSMDTILFDPEKRAQLNWEKRNKIIGGIARGLLYLHQESQLKIIHRDLKASNILLDADLNPKISDFGLARLFGGDQTRCTTSQVVGTFGYMAPEYVMHGQFSIKSDIYSFGILVLEIMTGRKNSDFANSEYAEDIENYVWERWVKGTILEILDPSLGNHCPRSEVLRCIHIGLLCAQENPSDRPNMSKVVVMLNSNSVSLQAPSRPTFCTGKSGMDSGAYSNEYD